MLVSFENLRGDAAIKRNKAVRVRSCYRLEASYFETFIVRSFIVIILFVRQVLMTMSHDTKDYEYKCRNIYSRSEIITGRVKEKEDKRGSSSLSQLLPNNKQECKRQMRKMSDR